MRATRLRRLHSYRSGRAALLRCFDDDTTTARDTKQQLGMVRHEGRSMAATTNRISATPATTTTTTTTKTTRTTTTTKMAKTKSKSRKRRGTFLAFGLLCLLLEQHLTLALDASARLNYDASHADDDEASAVAVGRSPHAPKFGERLLPLRKKTASQLNAAKVGAGVGAGVALPPMSSVNSVLNKANYFVSSAESAKVRKSAKEYAASEPSAPAEPPELYTVSVTTLDDYETTAPGKSVTRQSKQLHRRADTNVPPEPQLSAVASVANISKADRLEMSTEFFVVPTSRSTSTAGPPHVPARAGAKGRGMPALVQPPGGPRSVLIVAPKSHGAANNASATPPTIIATHPQPFTGLRKEPWVVPVLVLAALTMLMMAAFEIFVLFKAWRTSPSRRHLFLGQMLLLGLFACAGLGAIITAQPSLLSCGTIRFGVGVAYALVFAALLVKCVFLISLNGGVYLPAPYQGLLLLFAVLIQVAIGTQWLLTQPPELYTLSVPIVGSGLLGTTVASSTSSASSFSALFHAAPVTSYTPGGILSAGGDMYSRVAAAAGTVLIPLCKTQFSELLFSLIYIVFLIVFVAVLAIKSRGIRDNYREATYIGLAIGGAIPIWLGWMLCGLAVAERHKDACIAFGLVATSATVFLVMFMPKGRQLAAMGKEGLYVEDREEQFSSLSRAGSGYSPSFFHFKPIKYGVMGGGGMQNSASNTGNGASMKHCSNGLGGGDRVALVTAAPPSYTRMYHYFPAHLTTHPFCFYPQPPPPPLPPPPPHQMTQLPSPPTLKQLGNSLSSMTQAHIAQTLRYPGLFIRPDETNLYTTLEPTLSSNPNVYFQRGGAVHPGMMY